MLPTVGSKPAAPARGFIQTTRWARRRNRASAAASCSGGSLSQPSEPMSTTAPRSASPWCERNSARTLCAMRVPANRSLTRAAAWSIATSAEWCRSTAVSRVSSTPNANASASLVSTRMRIRCT